MDQHLQEKSYWKKCNICKKPIAFSQTYYLCSVSTCRAKRTGFTFCSVECWDAHLGFVKHRTSYAEEAQAPNRADTENGVSENKDKEETIESRRRIIVDTNAANSSANDVPTLVVVSKVKQFIRDECGMNTSQCAVDALTQKVVETCRAGIERAKEDGRKTVKGRDIL